MPVYVYHCDNSLKQTEIFQHYTDDPITVCPECKQPTLQKVYQVALIESPLATISSEEIVVHLC